MAEKKALDDEGRQEEKKKKSAPKAKTASVQKEVPSDEVEELEPTQTISLFLAVGLIIGALIVGLIVGYSVAPKGSSFPEVPAVETGQGQGSAPSLSPEQLQGGQLPAGHPQIPGQGATQTPSQPEQGGDQNQGTTPEQPSK